MLQQTTNIQALEKYITHVYMYLFLCCIRFLPASSYSSRLDSLHFYWWTPFFSRVVPTFDFVSYLSSGNLVGLLRACEKGNFALMLSFCLTVKMTVLGNSNKKHQRKQARGNMHKGYPSRCRYARVQIVPVFVHELPGVKVFRLKGWQYAKK